MSTIDHYSILGVLPDAEAVVIAAAYRALAQRYHPDKWQGSSSFAHERMCSINEAWRVLGDPVRRSEYDKSRTPNGRAGFEADDNDEADAFSDALVQIEEKWSLACKLFPDLIELRARLKKFSASLAFAFVTILLESKTFVKRADLAADLERKFLRRYFGTNEAIIEYAVSLVFDGQRAAAKKLNQLVDLLGSEVDPQLIINEVDSEFGLHELWQARSKARLDALVVDKLSENVRLFSSYIDAVRLARVLGYECTEIGGGFFISPVIEVISPNGKSITLKNKHTFVLWVFKNLCNSKPD